MINAQPKFLVVMYNSRPNFSEKIDIFLLCIRHSSLTPSMLDFI